MRKMKKYPHSQPQNCFPMLSSKEFRQRERESKTMSTILSIIIQEKKNMKIKERKSTKHCDRKFFFRLRNQREEIYNESETGCEIERERERVKKKIFKFPPPFIDARTTSEHVMTKKK